LFTIADTDTHYYFRIDNSTASATVTLPSANVFGKIVFIIPRLPGSTHPLTITTSANSIIDIGTGNANHTVPNVQSPIQFFSDGAGNWLLTL
jgi:hypothetical protein